MLCADNGISIWAPTRYLDELGCSAVQAGVLIAIPNIADFCSQFILGAVDYLLTARGWPKITLHRLNVGIGASLQALTLLVFGLSKSPAIATAAVCVNKVCHNMVGSWLSQGYMEIGGEDSGALKAYGTTACNLATMVLPCKSRFQAQISSDSRVHRDSATPAVAVYRPIILTANSPF